MGTRCPSPRRCLRSTTRWVIERATGSTTTRLRSPHTPSLAATSLPMMYCVTVVICGPFVLLVVLLWTRTHPRQHYPLPRTDWCRVSRFRGCSDVTLEVAQRESLGAEAAISNQLLTVGCAGSGHAGATRHTARSGELFRRGRCTPSLERDARQRCGSDASTKPCVDSAPESGGGADLSGQHAQNGRCLKPEQRPPRAGAKRTPIVHPKSIGLLGLRLRGKSPRMSRCRGANCRVLLSATRSHRPRRTARPALVGPRSKSVPGHSSLPGDGSAAGPCAGRSWRQARRSRSSPAKMCDASGPWLRA